MSRYGLRYGFLQELPFRGTWTSSGDPSNSGAIFAHSWVCKKKLVAGFSGLKSASTWSTSDQFYHSQNAYPSEIGVSPQQRTLQPYEI
jgi:hypothetical protein